SCAGHCKKPESRWRCPNSRDDLPKNATTDYRTNVNKTHVLVDLGSGLIASCAGALAAGHLSASAAEREWDHVGPHERPLRASLPARDDPARRRHLRLQQRRPEGHPPGERRRVGLLSSCEALAPGPLPEQRRRNLY